MGVIVKANSRKNLLLVKGAVENLLKRCTHIQLLDGSVVLLDDAAKALILSTLRDMSASALRCLGFAYKYELSEFATYDGHTIFCSFVGLRDPLR
jgi:P-type Ca2+ transporter type 2C